MYSPEGNASDAISALPLQAGCTENGNFQHLLDLLHGALISSSNEKSKLMNNFISSGGEIEKELFH